LNYRNETQMYPDVEKWMKKRLEAKYRRLPIDVYDTHTKYLSDFLEEKGLHVHFPDYPSYEIKVDVLGVIQGRDNIELAFVECKLNRITLRDVSQLLGYSKVAQPVHSILLSARGLNTSVTYLFDTFRRYDVLRYNDNKRMRIGAWNKTRLDIDPTSIIPRGELF